MTGKGSWLILIGLMGCGKSSVGQALAKQFKLPFADTDTLLEQQHNLNISEWFKTKGESSFRDAETALLETLTRSVVKPNITRILATGGGMILRETNRPMLKQLGHCVWLKADLTVLCQRLVNDNSRPLLAHDPKQHLAQLITVRYPIYHAMSDTVVDTSKKSIEAICKEIEPCLKP